MTSTAADVISVPSVVGASTPSRFPADVAARQQMFEIGASLLQDGLPFRVDEPHLQTLGKKYYLTG